MRVVLLTEVFCRGMGYLENMLPKYLARVGVEVHVIATGLPPCYWQASSADAYKGFVKELQPGTVETRDNYTLHILEHKRVLGRMRMVDLRKKLKEIRPNVVQTMAVTGWIPFEAAMLRSSLGYRLFTGCHHHASVFPLAGKPPGPWNKERLRCMATRTIPGRIVSLASEKCYAITEDCADVATRFFGVPRSKIVVSPLGVDTELFHPIATTREAEERIETRQRFGFSNREIVCIYTGRFSEDKNPLLLARAVEELRKKGEPYRGLFVGNGAQGREIQKRSGCATNGFVSVQELGALFRAADIGVWPTQESLSMLDAAACGLPIVANHTMVASERINGNGLAYLLNDLNDLIRVLHILLSSEKRTAMSSVGARKMAEDFSWESIAKQRLMDYEANGYTVCMPHA